MVVVVNAFAVAMTTVFYERLPLQVAYAVIKWEKRLSTVAKGFFCTNVWNLLLLLSNFAYSY